MTEPETTLIRPEEVRREWLLRCSDDSLALAVCSIVVDKGNIEIVGPTDDAIVLCWSEIAEFHAALHEAIERAEADLRTTDELKQAEAS
jgi:hypothetical protein